MMNRHILYIALMVVLLSVTSPKAAFSDVSSDEQNSDVSIIITKFQVNDQTLELTYEIKNDSNHDIWICDSVDIEDARSESDFEVFLDEDDEILLIRRRFDVPEEGIWEVHSYDYPTGRYVRLQSGQKRVESLSLDIPIHPQFVLAMRRTYSGYAGRLVLEIGFYDENLPDLVNRIIELAEKLNCTRLTLDEMGIENTWIYSHYFSGLGIAAVFTGVSDLYESLKEEIDEFITPYLHETFEGAQVLRATVEGVSIPYGNKPSHSETEPAAVTMALTGFDVNDTKLELSWKIMNNTDHDVWICDGVYGGSRRPEVYMAEDNQTLKVRKRFNIKQVVIWEAPPEAIYIRLQPGQERNDSLSLTVPVPQYSVFYDEESWIWTVEHAKRLVLEIGFYNKDLPGMIRGILDRAEKLKCAGLDLFDDNADITLPYFKGLWIDYLLGGFSRFNERNQDTSEEVELRYVSDLLEGESVLSIAVDGVSIPYKPY